MKIQMKKINLLSFVLFSFFSICMTSCSEEAAGLTDTENFIADIENRSGASSASCFNLVFPVSVNLGGEETTVDSYESLKEVTQAYKEAAGEDAERPSFVFPLTIENEDGEQTIISSQEEFKEVRSACDRRGGKGPKGGKGKCYDLVFPVKANIGGEESTFDDAESLRAAQEAYKNEAGEDALRLTLIFPVSIITAEGEQVEVATDEELKEVRSACDPRGDRGDRGDRDGRTEHCFDLVFPLTVTFGEEDLVFEDYRSLKEARKAYRQEAGEDAERPALVFPVTISYEDDTQVTVASQEELDVLKDACDNG